MRNLLPVLLLLISGCSGVKGVAYVGYDVQGEIEGGNPFAVFTVDGEFPLEGDLMPDRCGLLHISHYFAGRPFNNDKEDTADLIQCNWVLYE